MTKGLKRHWVEGEQVVGYMSTGQTRPLTEAYVEELNEVRRDHGEVPYAAPRDPYTFIAGHSHETPENNGGVEHTHS